MTEHHAAATHLTRRDPARNVARFYRIALAPTLFGEVALIRTWGRIGTVGQVRIETFGEAEDATFAGVNLERAKRRRGYVGTGQANAADGARSNTK